MDDENLRKVYEQYWLHARHQETQRLWFTNIYTLLIAGVFAYLGASGVDNPTKVLLFIFLAMLSLFGYLLTYAWNIPFTKFSRAAELISIKEWHLTEDYARFSSYKKGFRAGRLFTGFYSLMLGVFVALIVDLLVPLSFCTVINYLIIGLIFMIVSLLTYLVYHLYLEKGSINKIQQEFEDKVKASGN